MAWKLYLLQPLPFCRRAFRRFVYSTGSKCPSPRGFHDATAVIETREAFPGSELYGLSSQAFPAPGDPLWPRQCDCGYVFQPGDPAQDDRMRLFAGAPDGREHIISDHDIPPGACRLGDSGSWYIRMPHGDDFSPTLNYGGHRWSMVGTPPAISISPSINCVGSYHGHVKDGILTDDSEGRKFPQFPATA